MMPCPYALKGARVFKIIFSAFSKEVLSSRSVSLAFVALLISIIIAAVSYLTFAMVGVKVDANNKVVDLGDIDVTLRIVVLGVFLFSFVVIWFILYVQYVREADDIYSRLREKLVGDWAVQYELHPGQTTNKIKLGDTPIAFGEIVVNDNTRKLEIHFNTKPNAVFAGGKQVIRFIALRHISDDRCSMTYHYKMIVDLSPVISQHLLDDKGTHITELEVEIFAALEFSDQAPIKNMEGQWFDLNGNLIRLFAAMDEIIKHQGEDKIFLIKLPEAHITHANFSALMGDLTYTRGVSDA
jgi:hypothetical protein